MVIKEYFNQGPPGAVQFLIPRLLECYVPRKSDPLNLSLSKI